MQEITRNLMVESISTLCSIPEGLSKDGALIRPICGFSEIETMQSELLAVQAQCALSSVPISIQELLI